MGPGSQYPLVYRYGTQVVFRVRVQRDWTHFHPLGCPFQLKGQAFSFEASREEETEAAAPHVNILGAPHVDVLSDGAKSSYIGCKHAQEADSSGVERGRRSHVDDLIEDPTENIIEDVIALVVVCPDEEAGILEQGGVEVARPEGLLLIGDEVALVDEAEVHVGAEGEGLSSYSDLEEGTEGVASHASILWVPPMDIPGGSGEISHMGRKHAQQVGDDVEKDGQPRVEVLIEEPTENIIEDVIDLVVIYLDEGEEIPEQGGCRHC
ncbi:hypothetical protein AMTR_s00008p00237450 [Amborella trichopoda]|uniref:Uncharacterized protein n=1 Tax=Amborella trichopoda TaxID=13333 RepID=W1NJK3_AMBTC|nr:hypothetical protein AMTR_s00008p00237450 [Amborella trichopoda]